MEIFLVGISPHSDWITERYGVSLCIQSKCVKYATEKLRMRSLFTHYYFEKDLKAQNLILTNFVQSFNLKKGLSNF